MAMTGMARRRELSRSVRRAGSDPAWAAAMQGVLGPACRQLRMGTGAPVATDRAIASITATLPIFCSSLKG